MTCGSRSPQQPADPFDPIDAKSSYIIYHTVHPFADRRAVVADVEFY